MVRVFITGSSDGIGQKAAALLADQGHQVVLHARNPSRAEAARAAVPAAHAVTVADLSSISETKQLARDAQAHGPYDAIIHNAGIGYGATSSRQVTPDGISAVFAVNTLAPYILSCLMDRPGSRILYMSSDSHWGGDGSLRGVTQSHSYGDSKLHDVMLAKAFARRWPDIQSVSMHPGWVRTKMGGMAAPGSADKSARALADWAAGQRALAKLPSGAFTTVRGEESPHADSESVKKQEELMAICKETSGVAIPGE